MGYKRSSLAQRGTQRQVNYLRCWNQTPVATIAIAVSAMGWASTITPKYLEAGVRSEASPVKEGPPCPTPAIQLLLIVPFLVLVIIHPALLVLVLFASLIIVNPPSCSSPGNERSNSIHEDHHPTPHRTSGHD